MSREIVNIGTVFVNGIELNAYQLRSGQTKYWTKDHQLRSADEEISKTYKGEKAGRESG